MKRLVALTSTDGRTPKELAEELFAAVKRFKAATEAAKAGEPVAGTTERDDEND